MLALLRVFRGETLLKKDSKVTIIANGTFEMVHGNNPNVFADSQDIKNMEKQVEEAKVALTKLRKKYILPVFREAVNEFENSHGRKPSMFLLSYTDMNNLLDAYNKEGEAAQDGRKYVSTYGEDADRLIDGIRVKQGCDQELGEYRIYSHEG
jgi:hypothetical protein